VPVGVGEGAGVGPRLLRRLGHDRRIGGLGTAHDLVHVACEAQDALAPAAWATSCHGSIASVTSVAETEAGLASG
jgi:hypothetical protein